MLINDPETLASVTAAFEAYEHALMTNDIDALDALFWPSEFTVRIGPGQNLYGIAAIQAFRTARFVGSPPRTLLKTVITRLAIGRATARESRDQTGDNQTVYGAIRKTQNTTRN